MRGVTAPAFTPTDQLSINFVPSTTDWAFTINVPKVKTNKIANLNNSHKIHENGLEKLTDLVYNIKRIIYRRCFGMLDKTMIFSLGEERDDAIKRSLTIVYDALRQKGYNPINQIVGYILSEDPTYITTYNNARNIISKIDRDDLLEALVKSYLNV